MDSLGPTLNCNSGFRVDEQPLQVLIISLQVRQVVITTLVVSVLTLMKISALLVSSYRYTDFAHAESVLQYQHYSISLFCSLLRDEHFW